MYERLTRMELRATPPPFITDVFPLSHSVAATASSSSEPVPSHSRPLFRPFHETSAASPHILLQRSRNGRRYCQAEIRMNVDWLRSARTSPKLNTLYENVTQIQEPCHLSRDPGGIPKHNVYNMQSRIKLRLTCHADLSEFTYSLYNRGPMLNIFFQKF